MTQQEVISVGGIVTPCDWDEYGRVIGLKLCAPGEIDYAIYGDANGLALHSHLQNWVMIEGLLTSNHTGLPILQVMAFKVQTITKGDRNEIA